MNRSVGDASLKTTKALPAANANNSHDGIDLENAAPGVAIESVDLLLEVPATPSLADAKSITFTPQDSADNVTFTAIGSLKARTTTGAGGAGAAATSFRWALPSDVRRYVRVNQAVEAVGGDSTAVSTTVSLRF